MMKKLYYTITLLAALLAWGCSETLEETYDEYTEGGMIRYLGKCSDVEVKPGWERLQVIWKNNIDAGIKRVKITWQSENEKTPEVRYIERTEPVDPEDLMDTIFIENLVDAVYTVRVSNQSADSTESLIEEKYGRPYTETHEDLRTFTRGISAFSRMGDKLAIVLDQDNENVKELELCYYEVGKSKISTWNVKAHMDDSVYFDYYGMMLVPVNRINMFLLPEEEGARIDFNRPITVKREGRLPECVDEIKFQDEELDINERLWSTEFSQLMLQQYGPAWESEVNNVKTLELDYDFTSMQDLMYFPNLEKVILGKNRYMQPSQTSKFASTTDQYIGLMVLSFLEETRPSFEVERYNSHYFGNNTYIYDNLYESVDNLELYQDAGLISPDFSITEKGAENLDAKPVFAALDTTGWKVTCSDTLFNGYAANGAAWLLYDALRIVEDPWFGTYEEEVYFEPSQSIGASVVTVTFDMKTPQTVAGFKVGQPSRAESGDEKFLLPSLTIEFSKDGVSWTNATYADGSAAIGNSPGEETFISVPQDLRAPVRYIRLSMSSQLVGTISGSSVYCLRLGKFIPLKELTLSE